MSSDRKCQSRSLRDIELEIQAEGREWMRKRLEERLQQEADRAGAVFPPQRTKSKTPTRRGSAAQKRVRKN